MQRWTVGEVSITSVIESTEVFTPEFVRQHVLPAATPEALRALSWLAPHWADADGEPRFVSQTFLVQSRGRRVLVDTCIGNDKERKNPAFHRLATPFLERLAVAGAAPEDVDVVLCTHLHFDHVGWNTRWDGARWVPTFPRARHLFASDEWAYWEARAAHGYVMNDSLRPVMEAGLADLVDPDHAITDEVALVPTPGHTPGHVSVRIRSGGAEALITGDALHHPCQVAHPEWPSLADSDREQARLTRGALLDDAAARGVLVLGTHFAPPAAGFVVTGADGRRLVPGEQRPPR